MTILSGRCKIAGKEPLPMTAAKRLELIGWQTYLEGEARAKRKHEYVFGRIYAMAGARMRHNRVARNILGTLHQLLKGSPCEVFGSDAKVRIRAERGFVFFYPDVLV